MAETHCPDISQVLLQKGWSHETSFLQLKMNSRDMCASHDMWVLRRMWWWWWSSWVHECLCGTEFQFSFSIDIKIWRWEVKFYDIKSQGLIIMEVVFFIGYLENNDQKAKPENRPGGLGIIPWHHTPGQSQVHCLTLTPKRRNWTWWAVEKLNVFLMVT